MSQIGVGTASNIGTDMVFGVGPISPMNAPWAPCPAPKIVPGTINGWDGPYLTDTPQVAIEKLQWQIKSLKSNTEEKVKIVLKVDTAKAALSSAVEEINKEIAKCKRLTVLGVNYAPTVGLYESTLKTIEDYQRLLSVHSGDTIELDSTDALVQIVKTA